MIINYITKLEITGVNNDSDKSTWYQLYHLLEGVYVVNNC